MRPREHLIAFSKRYPNAWKAIDILRSERGKTLPFWPDWCFCPIAGSYAIVTRGQSYIPSPEEMNDISIMAALAAWRTTQGVYRFDPTLYNELIETPLTGDIPHDVLFQLPEWCIYVETPGLQVLQKISHGFFAHLEHDSNDGRKELRLLVDFDDKLLPLAIHLGPWNLQESVEKFLAEAKRNINRIPFTDRKETDFSGLTGIFENAVMPMLSLLL